MGARNPQESSYHEPGRARNRGVGRVPDDSRPDLARPEMRCPDEQKALQIVYRDWLYFKKLPWENPTEDEDA